MRCKLFFCGQNQCVQQMKGSEKHDWIYFNIFKAIQNIDHAFASCHSFHNIKCRELCILSEEDLFKFKYYLSLQHIFLWLFFPFKPSFVCVNACVHVCVWWVSGPVQSIGNKNLLNKWQTEKAQVIFREKEIERDRQKGGVGGSR